MVYTKCQTLRISSRKKTHVNTNTEAEEHSLENEDTKKVRSPDKAEPDACYLSPRWAELRHTPAGYTQEGFKTSPDRVCWDGERARVGEFAVVHTGQVGDEPDRWGRTKDITYVSWPKKTIRATTNRL